MADPSRSEKQTVTPTQQNDAQVQGQEAAKAQAEAQGSLDDQLLYKLIIICDHDQASYGVCNVSREELESFVTEWEAAKATQVHKLIGVRGLGDTGERYPVQLMYDTENIIACRIVRL